MGSCGGGNLWSRSSEPGVGEENVEVGSVREHEELMEKICGVSEGNLVSW